MDAALAVVPGDRFGHFAVAQLGQGPAFAGVALAAVLDEAVDRVGVAAYQGGERPARPDRAELVVVADYHEFGARPRLRGR